MLIGVSSSQGQGKTTLISSTQELGATPLKTQTARSILQNWDVTLDEVDKSPELRKRFQEEVVELHYSSISPAINSSNIYIVERTFADIFTYTVISLGLYNEYSNWLNEYYEKCKEYQQLFDRVVMLKGLNVNDLHKDGVRSINPHFATLVENRIEFYCMNMSENTTQVKIISSASHEDRINQMEKIICA